ncbi:molybdenum cofactor guanylyltransferase [Ancylomarina sp. DW003]|nr:molybdenum cofactor guanylyltransferase [Ancylomarina sp. DW003]MDE5422670.1 molybdenum cofactor guanylyltransferase [Ancylomarina sp. DW003]
MQKLEKKIVGIVLSGGKSRRMGQEKGLVKYQDKTLIEYAIESIQPLCDDLVISTANENYQYLSLPLIADEIPDCGPIGGIYTCMKNKPADVYLIISCDVPHVPTELFVELLQKLDGNAVIPVGEDERKQPLIACYSSEAFSFFEDAMKSNDLKMMNLLKQLNPKYYKLSPAADFYKSDIFCNLNSKDDMLK